VMPKDYKAVLQKRKAKATVNTIQQVMAKAS
jgi:hypothetical protein